MAVTPPHRQFAPIQLTKCLSLATLLIAPGCASSPRNTVIRPSPTSETLPSATGTSTYQFQDIATGVHLQYPATWFASPSKEFALFLLPTASTPRCRIVFDIPTLPLHIPGTIWLGLVQSQYIGRLKARHPDIHVDQSSDRVISPGVNTRLVDSSCTEDGHPHRIIGLLIVRADHVFVLSAGSDPSDFPKVKADFDKIAGSIRWEK